MSDFTKLIVWQKARTLCLDVYRVSGKFPAEEKFGLSSQMRRAAVSVVSNIAEGADRGTDKESKHFLLMARGSLSELQTQISISRELEFIELGEYKQLVSLSDEVHKMINGLIKSLARVSRLEARGL